jgi:hypothetical protein
MNEVTKNNKQQEKNSNIVYICIYNIKDIINFTYYYCFCFLIFLKIKYLTRNYLNFNNYIIIIKKKKNNTSHFFFYFLFLLLSKTMSKNNKQKFNSNPNNAFSNFCF